MRPPKGWAVWVGALIALGLLLAEMRQFAGAGDVALASETSSHTSAVCSLATLHGTYIFAADGVQIGGPDAGPFAYAGQIMYDGKGGVTEVYSLSFNGSISHAVRETGRYTVNPDCTASEVDSGGGSTQHYDTFLQPDGSQFTYVQTDSGVVSAGTAIRSVKPSKAD
jgi:hypothetical protein